MAKSITFPELMKKLAIRTKLSEKTVRKVYDALFELTSEELRFADTIKLKRFGVFYTVNKGGYDKRVPNVDGTCTMKYIEPYQIVKFKPSGEFTNYANGRFIDKESRRREREKRLSKNDIKLLNYKSDDKDRNLEVAVGEVLDVDGDCGGYNLGFAWMSGILAGKGCSQDD